MSSTNDAYWMHNYTNNNLIDFTATTCPVPSKKECEREIIYYLREYTKKKWWQEKKHLLISAKTYAKILNDNYKSCLKK